MQPKFKRDISDDELIIIELLVKSQSDNIVAWTFDRKKKKSKFPFLFCLEFLPFGNLFISI